MSRRWAALLSALAGLVTGLAGAEMTFGQLRPDAKQLRVHALLLGQPVVLQLDEEVVSSEDVLKARSEVARGRVVIA